jgi:hypothetical protein
MSFAYLTTLDEVLRTTVWHLEEVRRSPDESGRYFNLMMASRAMRCALQIHEIGLQWKKVKP